MRLPGRRKETRVTDLRSERTDTHNRVSAVVDGVRFWYAADNLDLTPSPEAFGSALLLPSIHMRRELSISAPVSPTWRDNAMRLSAIWSEWWGYDPAAINVPVRSDTAIRASSTALAFTCGVDSFHALLTGPSPERLVAVHGFDVPLADEHRMHAFAASVKAVAQETGIKWTIVRTNLREHSAAGRPWLWERSHGGALASVAHLLGEHAGHFTISSTYSADSEHAWGSAEKTDPLFSSDRVLVSHFGTHHHREKKVQLIAGNALAQRHLRVCWANQSRSGNCSRCEKCLATMLLLTELGALESFQVFEGTASLTASLDALPHLIRHMNIVERLVDRETLPPKMNDAARRLIVRSRKAAKLHRLRNRIQAAVAPHA